MGKKQSKIADTGELDPNERQYHVNMLILGASGSGKTSIVERWFTGKYSSPCRFGPKKSESGVTHEKEKIAKGVNIEILDGSGIICGGQSFRLHGKVGIFVYDLSITPEELKQQAFDWLTMINQYSYLTHLAVVGTKLDLEKLETRRTGESIASMIHAPHYAVSAKDNGDDLKAIMETITRDGIDANYFDEESELHIFVCERSPSKDMFDSI